MSYYEQKTATAVAYCKRGNGNLRVNGRPLDMIEPKMLQYKLQEPILLLGKVSFFMTHSMFLFSYSYFFPSSVSIFSKLNHFDLHRQFYHLFRRNSQELTWEYELMAVVMSPKSMPSDKLCRKPWLRTIKSVSPIEFVFTIKFSM